MKKIKFTITFFRNPFIFVLGIIMRESSWDRSISYVKGMKFSKERTSRHFWNTGYTRIWWAGGGIHSEVFRTCKDFEYLLKEAIRGERREEREFGQTCSFKMLHGGPDQ